MPTMLTSAGIDAESRFVASGMSQKPESRHWKLGFHTPFVHVRSPIAVNPAAQGAAQSAPENKADESLQ